MLEPVLTRYDRKAWPREQLKRGHLIWDLHSPMEESAMRGSIGSGARGERAVQHRLSNLMSFAIG